MDHPYWFHSPCVLWCLGVSRGHLVLTCWPSCSSAVIHKRIRRCSYDHRRRSPPDPVPPSLLRPAPQPLSKCHLANKTAVHTEPEQNAASSIHTASVKHPNKCCHLLQKPGCRLSFISLARAENFSPLIKEGIIANMAEIPTVILGVHVCVFVCERVWFAREGYEKAHCGHASVPN